MVEKPCIPPQNLDAERSVIASVLLMIEAIDNVGELKPEHFYDDRHQRLWQAILALRESGRRAIDAVILAEELDRRGELERIGGVPYLSEVMGAVPNAAHAGYYAEIVVSRWRAREAKYGANEIAKLIDDGSHDDEVVRKVETILANIAERSSTKGDVALKDVMVDVWGEIQSRLTAGVPVGIATGFSDIDELIVGLQAGELVVVAARPSMGKSAFASNLMHDLAKRGIGTLFVSLEMSKQELVERLLCAEGNINSHKMKSGTGFEEFEIDSLLQASGRLADLPIRIDDLPGQKLRQICATARRAKRKHGIGFVIVDYLQLIEANESKDVREQEVASITKGLKALAKELGIPIVVLAQLNRSVEMREDKRPRLGDLRESGAIEQDADKVLFLHRPAAYDPEDRPGECDVIIAKNRCGKVGLATLAWLAESTQFKDIAAKRFLEADAASRAFATRSWDR